MSLIEQIDKNKIPRHVAIIMDGNGRWAKAHQQERSVGHREGVVSVRRVIEAANNLGIEYLTLYTFSTENWNRPKDEVETLMSLMVYAIVQETPDMIRNNVRLLSIGDLDRLPSETRAAFEKCISETSACTGLTMVIAVSYSSRWEITNAIQKIAADVAANALNRNQIQENIISTYLSTKSIPDPDLLIRTGGEYRISNFLLWQLAYSELHFTDVFWPEFREEEFYQAILDYQCRERRFGKISEQIVESNEK